MNRPGRTSRLAPIMIAVGALFLPGCDAEPDVEILGRWELVEEPHRLVINFNVDGTYVADTDLGQYTGRWSIVEDGQLATWTDDARPKRVNPFRFVDGELLISDATGPPHRHRRVAGSE